MSSRTLVAMRIVIKKPTLRRPAPNTSAAYRHGLALALPEAVMARPTGVGRALATYEIPIEGRDEVTVALHGHAPPGERAVQGGGDDHGAARVDPSPAAARARGNSSDVRVGVSPEPTAASARSG